MTTVPTSSGRPITVNEKKLKPPPPASADASDTITLTGLPVRTSNDPALPAKAIGMSICDGG